MPAIREIILQPLHSFLQTLPAITLRSKALLSPLVCFCDHRAEIEVVVQAGDTSVGVVWNNMVRCAREK